MGRVSHGNGKVKTQIHALDGDVKETGTGGYSKKKEGNLWGRRTERGRRTKN